MSAPRCPGGRLGGSGAAGGVAAGAPSLDCGFSTIFRSVEFETEGRSAVAAPTPRQNARPGKDGGRAAEVYDSVVATQGSVSRHFSSERLNALAEIQTVRTSLQRH